MGIDKPYMTREELRKYVLRKLGANEVGIEITPEQLDDAINDALDRFNHYLCKAIPNVLAEQSGAVHIHLGPNVRGVVGVKVMFPESTREYAQMSIWEIMYRMVFPRMPLGDWYMMKSYYEMYQKIRGTEADWNFDESTNTLYVDCWSGPYDIFYVTAEDLTVENMRDLKASWTRDFRSLAVAEAKLTLAMVRGKYGNSIPTPGGTLTTDAEVLRSTGEAEKDMIEAKLQKVAQFQNSPVMWG